MTVDEAYQKYIVKPKENRSTEITDQDIKEISKGFRKGILNGFSSFLMCMAVSVPLSGYLEFLGIKNRLVKFEIDTKNMKENHRDGVIVHWCIEIEGKILDPTADQFKGMPKVFFGKRPIWYCDITD